MDGWKKKKGDQQIYYIFGRESQPTPVFSTIAFPWGENTQYLPPAESSSQGCRFGPKNPRRQKKPGFSFSQYLDP